MIRRARRRRRMLVLAAGLGALLAAAGVAGAQTETDLFRSVQASSIGIEFNFSNPGARSLAMGGAFIGRADDATAAYANPAGLVQLREPELSLELRSWQVPVKLGFPTSLELDETTRGVSFASYVHPRGRWTLALYRHEQADYDVRAAPPTSTRIELTGHAAAAAYRFANGLSLGAAVVVYDGALAGVATCQTFSGPCEPPGQVVDEADDTEVSGNVGLLWEIGRRWSVGAVYRRHTRFHVTSQQRSPGQPPIDLPAYTLRVPDVAGLGVGLRASSRLVLNFDAVRVRYSQALEDFGGSTVIVDPASPVRDLGEFLLDDVDELHFGLEYSFWNVRGAPALRLGAWHDPGHSLAFELSANVDCAAPALAVDQLACVLAEQFTRGDDRLHVSAGFGLVLGRRFQLDAGADVSDETETFSLSALVRF